MPERRKRTQGCGSLVWQENQNTQLSVKEMNEGKRRIERLNKWKSFGSPNHNETGMRMMKTKENK